VRSGFRSRSAFPATITVREVKMESRGSDIFTLFSEIYKNDAQEEMSLQQYLLDCRDDPFMYATAAERMIDAIGEPELIDTSEGLKIIHDEADWASVPASTYATEVSSWITQSVRLRLSRPRTSTSDGGDSIRNEAVFDLPGTTSISSRIGRRPRPAVWARTLPANIPTTQMPATNAAKRDMDTPITATPWLR